MSGVRCTPLLGAAPSEFFQLHDNQQYTTVKKHQTQVIINTNQSSGVILV